MPHKKHYRIHKSTNGQYYFTKVSANNKVTSTSETYKTKQGCKKGIKADFTSQLIIVDTTI